MTPMLQNLVPDLHMIMPEMLLAVGVMALMIVGAFRRHHAFKTVVIASVGLWMLVLLMILGNPSSFDTTSRVFGDMLVIDGFSQVTKIMILMGVTAALLIALRDLDGTIMARFEYPVLISFSALGMFLMLSANDLLALYVGLELSSLSLYVLAAFNRNSNKSAEAGLKYFVLGAISSGLLLFGASLIYGYVGSTQFDVIRVTLGASSLPGPSPIIVVFGMVMIICALAFKISAVPFHMWTPDVYEGAPMSVTALFAIVPKLAAMGLIIRLLSGPFEPLTNDWGAIISLIAIATMFVGAFAALIQKSIKRLLSYSSIGNMGYAMVGVAAASVSGYSGTLVYLAIYMAMTAGTFGVILSLRKNGFAVDQISDLAGLSKTHPFYAYVLAALMFSMSGIPPLAGFFGKLVVFQAAVASEAYAVAVIGVLTSVVAAWYYLNIIRVMFFETQDAEVLEKDAGIAAQTVIVLSLGFVMFFIVWPDAVMWAANIAGLSLAR